MRKGFFFWTGSVYKQSKESSNFGERQRKMLLGGLLKH